MQVLCIDSGTGHKNPNIPKEVIPVVGKIYNVISTGPQQQICKGIDMWHKLKETGIFFQHVSLFLPLPNEEGVTFAKRKEVLTHF
jgi:hypothetical protein